jgi:hypothetical protein
MDFDGLYLSGFAVLGRKTPAETRWILTSFTRWFSRHVSLLWDHRAFSEAWV